MFDNLQGSDSVTEETSAGEASTDEAVNPDNLFYGDEEEATAEASNEVNEESNDNSEAEVETYSFTLKADGEEHVLTSEEKVREYASKGIKFYNEMENLANERKSFESTKQEFETKLGETISKLESFIDAQPELNIDEMDSAEYIKEKEKRESAQKALDEAKSAQAQKQQEAIQQYQTQEINLLADRMGESWNDTEVMNADIQQAKEWFKECGATDDELKSAVNHKFWYMGIQAAKDRAKLKDFEAKKETVSKEIKKVPKTVKSSGKPTEVRDAADVFYG